MVDKIKYERYLTLKREVNFIESDIQFNSLLSECILKICFKSYTHEIRKNLLGLVFIPKLSKLKAAFLNNEIVFTDSHNRNDHKQLLGLIRSGIESEYIQLNNLTKSVHINLSNIWKAFKFSIRFKGELTVYECFFLFTQIVFYRNLLQALLKTFEDNLNLKCNKYIAFHNPFGIESLLVQFFKQKNIKTYTLSHGISYGSFKKEIPLDVVNGENITSDFVFVWGNSSKTEIHNNYNIDLDKILVGGNPKYRAIDINIKQSFRSCIVLLGRRIYEEGNKRILNIAYQLKESSGINFHIRLHPSLDIASYSKICNSLGFIVIDAKENLQDSLSSNLYDFAIVNNSTSYYEAMYYNMLCFRYELDENEVFFGLDDHFLDADGLKTKIFYYQSIENKILSDQVKNILIETLGMGVNNYKQILCSELK